MSKKIMIATPSHSGNFCAGYLLAMCEVFRMSRDFDVELNLQLWLNQSLVQKARNNLFAKAYLEGYDEIIFIDDDQGFSAEYFYKLLEHEVDVVGFPVSMKTEEERYNIRPENNDEHIFDPALNLLEVRNIGTGFLRMTRKAMDALWNNSPAYQDSEGEKRMICDLQIVNGGLIGEDIQICEKLREEGIKIYVDMSHTCKHYGTKEYSGNFLKNYVVSQLK